MNSILAKYAKLLVNYCLEIQPGDRLYVRTTTLAEPLVKELFREVMDWAEPRAQAKGVSISFTLAPDLGDIVSIDARRTRQAMQQLVDNAIKFTERGGVTVELSYDGESERLKVSVRDTGIGIRASKSSVTRGRPPVMS